jgi:hypothetical protein
MSGVGPANRRIAMKTFKFKKGDFVKIRGDVHDPDMPASRMGHLIEPIRSLVHYNNKALEQTDVWIILMTNGSKLKFHKMYLEPVQ